MSTSRASSQPRDRTHTSFASSPLAGGLFYHYHYLGSPMCTGAELNLRDRVLGNVGKNSFIALPGKGRQIGLLPLKPVSQLGGFDEEFYNKDLKVGLQKIRVCAGPAVL